MSGEATNEIYTFSLYEMKKWHFGSKKLNLYNFKRDRFFALIDVIHVHTLRHINDDVA